MSSSVQPWGGPETEGPLSIMQVGKLRPRGSAVGAGLVGLGTSWEAEDVGLLGAAAEAPAVKLGPWACDTQSCPRRALSKELTEK